MGTGGGRGGHPSRGWADGALGLGPSVGAGKKRIKFGMYLGNSIRG